MKETKPGDRPKLYPIPTNQKGVYFRQGKGGSSRRLLIERESARCFWCRCRVFLKQGYANSATLDHLYSRFDARRSLWPNNDRFVVLACYGCNQARQHIEQEMMRPDYLLEKSDFRMGLTRENKK